MKYLSLSLIALLLLTGCEVFHGPSVRNDTNVFIEIWVDYSNGRQMHDVLSARTTCFQREKGVVPIHAVVVQEGRRFEFDPNFFQELWKHADNLDKSVVYFDGKTLDVISTAEARRRGFWTFSPKK